LSTGCPQLAQSSVHNYARGVQTLWIFLSCLALFAAICACVLSGLALKRGSVTSAAALSKLSEMEKAERLTPSKLAALAEFNESLARAEELLVKVNRREIARAKKRADDGTFTDAEPLTLKDQLRKRAGLVAGKPAPHREVQ